MSAFDALTLFELYDTAKQGYSAGFKGNVWISTLDKQSRLKQVQTYQDICTVYNNNKPMTYTHLFKFLTKKLNKNVIVFD